MNNKKFPHKHADFTLKESFGFALEGLQFTFKNERNFRIHLATAAYVLYFTLRYYSLSKGELSLLILTMMIVLVSEVLNTAIEKIVDLVTPDYNTLAKIAKDVAAGGVFLSALGSILVGLILLWNPSIFYIIFKDLISHWYLWSILIGATLLLIRLPNSQKTNRKQGVS